LKKETKKCFSCFYKFNFAALTASVFLGENSGRNKAGASKAMQKINLLNHLAFVFSIFVISFFGFLIGGHSAYAGALTATHVQPVASSTDDLIGATNANWKFSMTNATALNPGQVIHVIFPDISNAPQFEYNNPTLVAATSIDIATSSVQANPGIRTVAFVITSTTSPNTSFSVTIDHINNPLANLSDLQNLGWIFRTGTTTDDVFTLSQIADQSATTTASLIRGGGPIASDFHSSITPSNYDAGATNVTYTFVFTASTSIPSGGKIGINFPSEFALTSAATTTDDDNINGGGIRIANLTTQTTEGRNRVILTTSGGATAHNDVITVAVTGLTNPALGVYRPFFIYTTTANGGLLDGSPFGGGDDSQYANTVPPVDTVHIGGTNNITFGL
jgi:hypothetical protein